MKYFLSLFGFVLAQTLTPQMTLERLFTQPLEKAWFAQSFLEAVPFEQIEPILKDLTNQYGAYQNIQEDGEKFQIILERASVPSSISLDNEGKIVGLFFEPPVPLVADISEAAQAFKNLPGQVSLLIIKDNKQIISHNSDLPLAVGSTFKLAILNRLQNQINEGKHRWDEVITLKAEQKSLPSGILQNWPDGSQLTLETLATLMISQSDNTATDVLLEIVGRETIEALSERNQPFLSTREAFVLKDSNNQILLERFISGDLATKRAVLDDIAQVSLDPNLSWSEPRALEVEWYFSNQELCKLMQSVEDLPLMTVNPGIQNTKDWNRVSYKGGSEPGVLNMTIGLQSKTGEYYCVSATWNDTKMLNEVNFFGLFEALIGHLK
jgi:beta-lactamase class A